MAATTIFIYFKSSNIIFVNHYKLYKFTTVLVVGHLADTELGKCLRLAIAPYKYFVLIQLESDVGSII